MRTIAVVALSLLLLLPGPAFAADQTEADRLFAEGRDLLEKGRFAEACERLRKSEELAPAVGTLINLGYCYEQISRLSSAMDAYAEAETLAKQANDEKRERFARERFLAVEPKALKLVLRVAERADGLEVKKNNDVVPPAQWGVPIPVDPEDIVITATAPGRVPWRGAVIGRGEGAVITVVVPSLEQVGGGATRDASRDGIGLGMKRLVALGLGGVALAGIGAGAGLALSAKSRYDDSLAHCEGGRCDAQGISEQEGAVAQGNVATVLIAVGLACAGGGIFLWLTGGDEGAARAARLGRPGVVTW